MESWENYIEFPISPVELLKGLTKQEIYDWFMSGSLDDLKQLRINMLEKDGWFLRSIFDTLNEVITEKNSV